MERALIVLLVVFVSAFVVDARSKDNEEKLEGPRGLKAFVGRTGGGIRLYREMQRGPEGKSPPKTGEIEIRLGRIREANDTDTVETDSEEMDSSEQREPRTTSEPRGPRRPLTPNPPGGRPPKPPERPDRPPKPSEKPPVPPRGRPSRPRLERPDVINFNVVNSRNQNLQRGAGPEINGDCLILRSPPMREVDDSELTLTVCTVKDNGSLTIGDEETEISSGQLKFTMQLDNWPWSSDGQFVDVDVIMKVPRGRMVSEKSRDKQMEGGHGMGQKRRPVIVSLGDNATASFPRKVELDNSTLVDMPDGFPSTPRKRGHDYIITLRFPRFNTTVFYDPAIDTTNEETTYGNDTVPTDGMTTTADDIASMAPCRSCILPLCVGLLLALAASK